MCNRIVLNTATKKLGLDEEKKKYACLVLEFWPL